MTWSGAIKLGSFWGLHRGAVGDNCPHAHHALQVSAAPDGLRVTFDEKPIAARGVFIASMRRHSLALNPDTVSLYVDAASPVGRWVASAFAERERLEEKEAAALCRLDPTKADDAEIVSYLSLAAQPAGTTRPRDARLTRALALLEEGLEQPLPLERLARGVKLSEGRLSRLFHRELGMPFRPYRRWRRVQQALVLMQRGVGVTEAAITSGFSDSAHFSRTIRRVFGVRPSEIALLIRQIRSSAGRKSMTP